MESNPDAGNLRQEVNALARNALTSRHDLRGAVHELALHALRSRPLTARHLASVARTVREGIEGNWPDPAPGSREAQGQALGGLCAALSQGLQALELSAREFVGGGGRLEPGEASVGIAEIEALERGMDDACLRMPGTEANQARARLAALASHWRRAAELASQQGQAPGAGAYTASSLAMMASGALLALSEAPSAPGQVPAR